MAGSSPRTSNRSMPWLVALALFALGGGPTTRGAEQTSSSDAPPVQMTREEDHERTMKLLGLTSFPRGAASASIDTYDESKANPYPNLPDPLVMKNGRKVTSAAMWRNSRRAEIIEDFEREVYGRRPKTTPKVTWEVKSTTNTMNGDVPIVTKELIGHVDNSSYPAVTVDIQVSLSTPANAAGPVPVIMQFGGGFGARGAGGRGAPGTGAGVAPPAGAPGAAPGTAPPASGQAPAAGAPTGAVVLARPRLRRAAVRLPHQLRADAGHRAPPGSSSSSPGAGVTPPSLPTASRQTTARA